MPTLEDLRMEARMSIAELSRRAKVDMKMIKRAINGEPVQKVKVMIVLDALSKELGRPITIEDVEGINIYSKSVEAKP